MLNRAAFTSQRFPVSTETAMRLAVALLTALLACSLVSDRLATRETWPYLLGVFAGA